MEDIIKNYSGVIISVLVLVALCAVVVLLVGGGDASTGASIIGKQITDLVNGMLSKSGL
ncbi:hypothetical protein [Bifidobacterium fermentum]|uniref:Lipoprotein n=1 Tax=Bifidobacterium fermentum TaxID=3059035 RepID=A0AB39UF93_9BIFI